MPRFKKAKDYALYLLKFRSRSKKELEDRLRRKGFAEDEVEEALADLERAGLLDDADFARSLVRSRMRELWGKRLIEYELGKFGIRGDEARSALEEVYDEDFVRREAVEKVLKLAGRWKGMDRRKKREKVIAYFSRRGHSYDFIKSLLEEAGL
ncbi:MAG: RecX family transcriptional regulator [Candidatus Hydrothermae bacterium]|nr:RecX family transcriptional regulator [Candidatus Hydrothermae bacterium]